MKTIKFLSHLLSLVIFSLPAQTQQLAVGSATNLTLQSGTTFYSDGLTLTPSIDFVLTNTILNKNTALVHTSGNKNSLRVYQFSNTTPTFTGSIQINYTDGAELNGIAENALTLNVHNGTAWVPFAAATRDNVNNNVLINDINNLPLNELTLADLLNPLPLVWLSFSAVKENNTVLLDWSTSQEQNTKSFTVLYGTDATNWQSLFTMPAAGNSSITKKYHYTHHTPGNGINYYRILETDNDNKVNLSQVKPVDFSNTGHAFTLLGNPVTNGVLRVQVNKNTSLMLYAADGKLVWQGTVSSGINSINVSKFAKGTYVLKTSIIQQKILIQ
jgi:hypothetical protein